MMSFALFFARAVGSGVVSEGFFYREQIVIKIINTLFFSKTNHRQKTYTNYTNLLKAVN